MIVCRFQGLVGLNIAVEGILKGIPIPTEALARMISAVPPQGS
jgi:hypothetical protein